MDPTDENMQVSVEAVRDLVAGVDIGPMKDHVADALMYSAVSATSRPQLEISPDGVFVEVGGKRTQLMAYDEMRPDISGIDLRGAKISADTRIDVRTWKALALMGCVDGYAEEKAAEEEGTRD